MPSAPIRSSARSKSDFADRAGAHDLLRRPTAARSRAPTRSSRPCCAAPSLPSTSCRTSISRRSPRSRARRRPSRPSAACRDLTGAMTFKLPPTADELRELSRRRAVRSLEPLRRACARIDQAAGLAQRDYIPLASPYSSTCACCSCPSGGPMNRFVATRQRMIEAERGPVFPILSRFSEIHDHEEMRRTFDVFREVIFESGGTYYVAVPLNAPRGHPERERLRRDAQALANLCYALEGQGVLARPWKLAPSLVARRKLRRQGSKFIECYRDQQLAPMPRGWRALKSLFVTDRAQDEQPAFRIYAFKSGAWPELILGAVMGAASRIEAERRRDAPVTEVREEPTGRSRETDDFYADLAREQARMAAQDAAPGIELPSLDETAPSTHDRGHNGAFAYRPAERPSLDGSPRAARRSAVNGAAAADLRPAGGELRPGGLARCGAPRGQTATTAASSAPTPTRRRPSSRTSIRSTTRIARSAGDGRRRGRQRQHRTCRQRAQAGRAADRGHRGAVSVPACCGCRFESARSPDRAADDGAERKRRRDAPAGSEHRRRAAARDGDVHGSGEPGFAAGGARQTHGGKAHRRGAGCAPELDASRTWPETIHLGGE